MTDALFEGSNLGGGDVSAPASNGVVKADKYMPPTEGNDIGSLTDHFLGEALESNDSATTANEAMDKLESKTPIEEKPDDVPTKTEPEEPGEEPGETGQEESEAPSEELGDFFEFKSGDKSVKVPKDAKVELKVNGKKQTLPLQEALNKASGNIHVEKETARLGRERKDFEASISTFKQQAEAANTNMEILAELGDSGDIFGFCEYYCELKGGDPDQMYQEMLQTTLESMQNFANMSETERAKDRELRRYKRTEKQRAVSEQRQQKAQERTSKHQALENTLKEKGFKFSDWQETIDSLQAAAEAGEEVLDGKEDISENDIIEYMVRRDLDTRLQDSISQVNEKILEDTDFVERLTEYVYQREFLNGRLKPSEVTRIVKQAIDKDHTAIAESLSRKVGKTNSKNVNSLSQEEEYDGPLNEEQFWNALRTGKF